MSRNSRRAVLLLAIAVILPACGVGSSGGTLTPTVAPAAPTGLQARSGHHRIRLSWTPSPAASEYNVRRSLSSGGPYAPLAGGQAVTASEFVDGGLTNGAAYYYVVTAVNSFGESGPSAETIGRPGFVATQVSSGGGHSVALLADGSVWAWGYNGNGELGIGSSDTTFTNVALPVALEGAVTIASGYYNSFAILSDGSLWSWGTNLYHQLGDGTDEYQAFAPVRVVGLSDVVAVSGGALHAMALRRDGTVWVWGQYWGGETSTPVQLAGLLDVIAIDAGENYSMALRSDGTVWSWSSSDSAATRIPNLDAIRRIAAGDTHSLALRNDGTLWAWGNGLAGELGTGLWTSSSFPLQVIGLTGVEAVSAGWESSVAVRSDGTVWAFGRNGSGQAGLAGPLAVNVPVRVGGLAEIREVSAAGGFVTALDRSGTVWSWGLGFNGQLGGGTGAIQDSPVQVANLTGVASISGGGNHSLAARTDGTAWSWGDNFGGALGNGTTDDSFFRTAVSPVFPSPVVQVSAGHTHSAARLENGEVWAWGVTPSGGSTTNVLTPVKVGTLSGVTSLSSGLQYNLALVGATGTLWFWGRNWNGVRANGTVGGDFPAPVTIPLTNVVKAAAGHTNCLAIRSDQSVWRWGRNPIGGPDTTTPVQVTGLTGIIDIASGDTHALAVRSDGTVWAWGSGNGGELGDGLRTSSATPVQAVGLPPVVQVEVGLGFSLALGADGTVWAWGDNTWGQLGRNQPYMSPVPIQVPGIAGAVQVAAAQSHAMARLADGTVLAWGDNQFGAVGIGTAGQSHIPLQVTR
jgi:alpha-tubulin suppressor-like RCC1 family protein